MANVELRTRYRTRGPHAPELILDLLLTPRGSGNRRMAQGLAAAAKSHPRLGRHVRNVVAGSSRVRISLKPSVELTRDMLAWNAERSAATPDVEGQLPLFGGPIPT